MKRAFAALLGLVCALPASAGCTTSQCSEAFWRPPSIAEMCLLERPNLLETVRMAEEEVERLRVEADKLRAEIDRLKSRSSAGCKPGRTRNRRGICGKW